MKPPAHATLDIEHALAWCQGDRAQLERLWQQFHQQFYPTPTTLTPQQGQALAHDLKASALPCGALRLAHLAQQLAPPAPLPERASTLALRAALDDALAAIAAQLPKAPIVDDPEPALPEEVRALHTLLSQLALHSFNALEEFTRWSEQFALDWPRQRVDDVNKALRDFDFRGAERLLRDAYQRHGRYPKLVHGCYRHSSHNK